MGWSFIFIQHPLGSNIIRETLLCALRIQWKIFFCGRNIAIKFEPNRVQFIHEYITSDETSGVYYTHIMHLLKSADVRVSSEFHFSTFSHLLSFACKVFSFSFHFWRICKSARVCMCVCAVLTVTIIIACIAR